jgi:hypothetical protein
MRRTWRRPNHIFSKKGHAIRAEKKFEARDPVRPWGGSTRLGAAWVLSEQSRDSLFCLASCDKLIKIYNNNGVGAKAKTLSFALAFVYLAAPAKAKRSARSTLRPLHYKMKAYDDVAPSHVLTRPGGTRGIRPIIKGPARRVRVTGSICNDFSVMIVCNPPL